MWEDLLDAGGSGRRAQVRWRGIKEHHIVLAVEHCCLLLCREALQVLLQATQRVSGTAAAVLQYLIMTVVAEYMCSAWRRLIEEVHFLRPFVGPPPALNTVVHALEWMRSFWY